MKILCFDFTLWHHLKKVFVKNLILFQALNLVIKPLWILMIDREAQNILGQDYSDYYVILNLAVVLNIVLDLGIQNFNNTEVASDARFFKYNFKNIVIAKLILSLFYLCAALLAGISSGLQINLLLIIGFNQVLTSLLLYLRTNINGLHHFTLDGLLSVSDKFFGIVLCLGFYFTGMIEVFWFAMAQLLATILSFMIALFYNFRYLKQVPLTQEPGVVHSLKQVFIKSLPYALLFALMNMYTRGDVMMMKWLLPDSRLHTGIYAQGYRLLDASAMFAMLFAGLLLPMFARMISEGSDVRPLAKLATSILLPVAVSVSLGAFLFSEKLMPVLYDVYKTSDISYLMLGSKVFSNILLSFIPMSLTFVFSTLLTAKADLRYLNIFALSALVCNFTLNYFLIPERQSWGASLSTLITQSLFAVLCLIRCFHLFKFRLGFKEVAAFTAWMVSLIGVYFIIKGIENLGLQLIVFGGSALILVFLFRIFRVGQILQLFDKKIQ